MLKSQDQVRAMTSQVLAPVNFIVLLIMIMVAGLVILTQSIMADQSDRMIRATVSGLMAEQKKSLASEVEALAVINTSGFEPSRSFGELADYTLIMAAHGQTLKAVSDFASHRVANQAADLLEISELRHFHAI